MKTTMYLADVLETATRRFIATTLGELEGYTGEKRKDISDVVKDDANRCKRLILRRLTGMETEAIRGE